MINPAVTIAMAVFRRYPLIKVPGVILSQIVGCFFATLVVYLNYTQKISQFEVNGGRSFSGDTATAGNFISTPKPAYLVHRARYTSAQDSERRCG